MSRSVFLFVLLGSAGPLWACNCGAAITYAPIVATPTAAPVVEAEPMAVDVQEPAPAPATKVKVERPAIPKSIYPDKGFEDKGVTEKDSVITKTQKPQTHFGARLKLYDLPVPKTPAKTETKEEIPQYKQPTETVVESESDKAKEETQTVEKPVVPFDEASKKKQEEIVPPEPTINIDEEEKKETNRGQSPSRGAEEGLKDKPEPPEGVSDKTIPESLRGSIREEEPEPTDKPSRWEEDRPDRGGNIVPPPVPTEPPSSPGNAGGTMDTTPSTGRTSVTVSQWTVTALVLLAAISTGAFLCTVFVVGEYRRRWLNAIMSQNGIVPGFRDGMYDLPGISTGYGRYED